MEEFIKEPYNKADDNAEQDHGGDWKVKPEVFLFNPYITGKPSNPG
jgi:hypothetical protein